MLGYVHRDIGSRLERRTSQKGVGINQLLLAGDAVTIRNEQNYMNGVWDWGILDGCFGDSKMKPTDIDGLVEHHGRFLVLETKFPGAPVPTGQMITFNSLVRFAGAVVIIVWGKKNKPERLRVYSPKHPDGIEKNDPDGSLLRTYVSAWYKMAEANPRY